jgi:hypothetical protein
VEAIGKVMAEDEDGFEPFGLVMLAKAVPAFAVDLAISDFGWCAKGMKSCRVRWMETIRGLRAYFAESELGFLRP